MSSSGDISSQEQAARLLLALRNFVIDEKETARFNLLKQWRRPLSARARDGRALAGVRVLDLDDRGDLWLACDDNQSRFREGDALRLNRGVPVERPFVRVSLERDEGARLLVSVDERDVNIGELLREPQGWALDEDFRDLSGFYLEALDQVARRRAGYQRILPLLLGQAAPRVDLARCEQGVDLARQAGLNDSQQEALGNAYACDLVHLIHGPPGTGKTRVLAHLAQALCGRGERVLVTAFTHRAIDNALATVARVAPRVPVVKICQRSRAQQAGVETHERLGDWPPAEGDGAYVVGATPFATRGRLEGARFDTLLVDEASQVTLPLAVMAMLAARRYVFIGDDRQLPPVLGARHSDPTAAASIYAALKGRGFETLLDRTYRLCQPLASWPSRTYYGGRLSSAPDVADRRLELARQPARHAAVLRPGRPKVFVQLEHQGCTVVCAEEARLIVSLCIELLRCGLPAAELGVVAPYRAQGREIRRRLARALDDPRQARAVVADTVERMQGQEREVILVSLTTSSRAFAANLAGFFFQPQRLNVTITRPRTKLVLLGSRQLLQVRSDDARLQRWIDSFKQFIGTCQLVPGDSAG